MARIQHDREDLLAEGVNMPVRGQLQEAGEHRFYFVGWRKDGGVRVFDDVDPVYQFDSDHRLRRVYFAGQKLVGQNHVLVRLQRQSQTDMQHAADRITHRDEPLDDKAYAEVLARWRTIHTKLLGLAQSGELKVVGLSETEYRERLRQWLAAVTSEPQVAT